MLSLRTSLACVVILFGAAFAQAQSYTFSNWVYVYSNGGILPLSDGTALVSGSNGISRLSATGTITAFVGSTSSGTADGTGLAAGFNAPRGMVVDSAGNVYVADSGNNAIRKVTPAGVVTTFAGKTGSTKGSADGTGSAAQFSNPWGLVLDTSGNLFVTDANNATIRKIAPDGSVTTFAGTAGQAGTADGIGSAVRFNQPEGLAIDTANNLYVADTYNHAIRKITPAGVVTTLAGLSGSYGAADGTGSVARFNNPSGLAADAAGNLYVADTYNYAVRKVTPAGVVTTIGGSLGNYSYNYNSGLGAAAGFSWVNGIAVDRSGTLYLTDSGQIRLGVTSNQLAFTIQPQTQTVGIGSTATFSPTVTGGTPITYQWQKNGVTLTGATNASLVITSVQSSDAAAYTVSATNAIGTVLSSTASLTVVGAVPNDNFANAQVISGASGSVSGTTQGATGESLEPTHYNYAASRSSVWYAWTAPTTGTTQFTLIANYGVAVAIYTGSSLASLKTVTVGTGGPQAFRVTSGETYFIAVGAYYESNRGIFTLNWTTLTNDDFANADTLTGDTGTASVTTSGATLETGEPIHSVNGTTYSYSVWYKWTPSQTGTATFNCVYPSYGIVDVYTGTALSNLVPVSDYRQYVLLAGFRTVIPVTGGTTYWIAVSGGTIEPEKILWSVTPKPVIGTVTTTPANTSVSNLRQGSSLALNAVAISATPMTYQWSKDGVALVTGTSASLSFTSLTIADSGTYAVVVTNPSGTASSGNTTLTVLAPPTNDAYTSAVPLPGQSGSLTGNNQNATGETSEPIHWNVYGTASSIWYQWTAPATGLAVLNTTSSKIDTVLAVYTGTTLTTLNRLTQDNDGGGGGASVVSFAATAGTTYSIAVGGATSLARGAITLNWQLTPTLAIVTPPANQTVAVGGSAVFSVTASGSGVTYQWYRNGILIPGATSSTLTLSNLAAGDDATYSVTVTNSSGSVTSTVAALAVSAPQLTNFTSRNSIPGADLLWSIAAGNGTLVTVGGSGTVLTSDDGQTWIPRSSGTTNWLVGVTYGNNQFVAVGDNGTIITSPDGRVWSTVRSSGTTVRLNNVIYAAGEYVAVGEAGVVVTSNDAQTWTARLSGVTGWLHGLAYNSDISAFATSGQGGAFLYSTDGITWTKLTIDGLTDDLEATVAVTSYANFVAVGSSGKVVAVHQNNLVLKTGDKLTTWSADVYNSGSGVRFRGLAVAAGALFASGEDGKIITAADAAGPWVTVPSGTTANLLSGIYFNHTLFLVGDNETIVQSDVLYSSRLINISTRANVGTGDNILISGFVITGTTPKPVLIRAAGPALAAAPFNMSGTLSNPVLTLFDSDGKTITSNTGWGTAANASSIETTIPAVGAFPFTTGSADSAILTTLSPGGYTAQVAGANGKTGIAIVEVYDADPLSTQTAQAVNLSSRGVTSSGDNRLIAGFVINGASSRRVLIRAVGPGLAGAPFNISGTLAAPQLELYNSHGGLYASAGAWGLQSNADEIRSAAQKVAAFSLPEGGKDSAMVITLLPGSWTVQVGSADNGSGVVITEIYVLP